MTYLKHHEPPSLLHDRIRRGGKPGGTDGPHPVPVELGILSDLLGPSLSASIAPLFILSRSAENLKRKYCELLMLNTFM